MPRQMQDKPQPPNLEKLELELATLSRAYRRLFSSPEGRQVILDLKSRYSGELVTDREHTTLVNMGSYRVLQYITEMIEEPYGDTEST